MTTTLSAFSASEKDRAHRLLAAQVAQMNRRKLEEDDWATVYCIAKGIPKKSWSNLNLDIIHGSLGVEHKMLKRKSDRPLLASCGEVIMHPSATRSIRIPRDERNPNKAMEDILRQYQKVIEDRTSNVESQSPNGKADMRTGWLLWQESLKEFLYFEERMEIPNPESLYAVWNERGAGGARKGSKNLWIFDRKTKQKLYSVTTEAGPKIQPYFTVPDPTDRNLYHFVVQGESVEPGLVRMWLSSATVAHLKDVLGSIDVKTLSDTIMQATLEKHDPLATASSPDVVEVRITYEAYQKLTTSTQGVSDEHCAQLLIRHLVPEKN